MSAPVESVVDLPDTLRDWVESVCDASVISASPHSGGASRHAWTVDVADRKGSERALFLLGDKSGTGGSQRDAAVLRALHPTPVPVPAVVAESRELRTLLLERIAGRSDFPSVERESEREPTARHLMELAAALHRLDPGHLAIAHLERPENARALAREQIGSIERSVAQLGTNADPLLGFALDWLRRHVPDVELPWSLVHSDLGPGNFVYSRGRVRAIVDWEMAHLGDPMEDLAALSIRDIATPVGSLSRRFREYEAASGIEIDLDRITYYRLLVLIRNSALIQLGLASPPPGYDLRQMTAYVTLLMRAAALVLCDATGAERPSASESDAPDDAAREQLPGDSRGDQDRLLARSLARRMLRLGHARREIMGPLAERMPQPLEKP
ncbi:MAG: phosphotransferase [bacterium]